MIEVPRINFFGCMFVDRGCRRNAVNVGYTDLRRGIVEFLSKIFIG
jgi:hypothetical protein